MIRQTKSDKYIRANLNIQFVNLGRDFW